MYSRTPNGFNEQQAPRIPAEVYGHVFTAQEKANLRDGKTLLVEGLKTTGRTVQFLPESQSLFRAVAVFSGKSGHPQGHFPPCAQTETAQGQQQEEEGCIAGGIDLPEEKKSIIQT